jgi:hypothetical protein
VLRVYRWINEVALEYCESYCFRVCCVEEHKLDITTFCLVTCQVTWNIVL